MYVAVTTVTTPVALDVPPVTVSPTWNPDPDAPEYSSLDLSTTVIVQVVVGGFLKFAEYPLPVESAYPDPAVVIVPWKPGTVNVAVADVPLPPVNAMF